MPFKNLEHDGNEVFTTSDKPTRKKVIIDKKIQQKQQDLIDNDLEKKQQEYLHINNPLLWAGDFDDD